MLTAHESRMYYGKLPPQVRVPFRIFQFAASKLKNGNEVLDLGGGQGNDAFAFVPKGITYNNVDISKSQLSKFELRMKESGFSSSVRSHHSDILDFLRGTKKQYDLIISMEALHHLTDRQRLMEALKLAAEKVKPGGLVALSIIANPLGIMKSGRKRWFKSENKGKNVYREAELKNILNGVFGNWKAVGRRSKISTKRVTMSTKEAKDYGYKHWEATHVNIVARKPKD